MQSVAVISDIHANMPALEAVLEEIDGLGIEHILCCGDIVGYLMDDADIIATLDELAVRNFSLGFFGHSHDQLWFTKSPKGVVKRSDKAKSTLPADRASAVVVGSVGQPRTGDPRAAWTLWQPQTRAVEFRRTDYPVDETMAAIKACGLPMKSARRLLRGV